MRISTAVGSLALAAGITGLVLPTAAEASPSHPINAPTVCAIQTSNGHYLTAVDGGGRTTEVIHTDATRVKAWEKFVVLDSFDGTHYGLLTTNGHYLTAVGGGGRTTDVIHSDAVTLRGWEKFAFVSLGHGKYAIKTSGGHYLTAVGGGGRTTDTIHSDATQARAWETFRLHCHL